MNSSLVVLLDMKKNNAFEKAKAVIISCTTLKHVETAWMYVFNFHMKFKDSELEVILYSLLVDVKMNILEKIEIKNDWNI